VDASGLELDFVDVRPSGGTRIVQATVTIRNPGSRPVELDLSNIHLKRGAEDVPAQVISQDREASTVVTIPPERGSKRVARKLAHPGTRFRLLFELERVPKQSKMSDQRFYLCCGAGTASTGAD
jgi:hypothetical protein